MKQTEHSFDNTERGRLLFSPGMKLADLVESNYELLVVLARMGIPLGRRVECRRSLSPTRNFGGAFSDDLPNLFVGGPGSAL